MGFTLSYMYLRTKLNSSTSTPKRVALSTPGVLNVHAVTFGLTLKESADLEKQQEGSHISPILSELLRERAKTMLPTTTIHRRKYGPPYTLHTSLEQWQKTARQHCSHLPSC